MIINNNWKILAENIEDFIKEFSLNLEEKASFVIRINVLSKIVA